MSCTYQHSQFISSWGLACVLPIVAGAQLPYPFRIQTKLDIDTCIRRLHSFLVTKTAQRTTSRQRALAVIHADETKCRARAAPSSSRVHDDACGVSYSPCHFFFFSLTSNSGLV